MVDRVSDQMHQRVAELFDDQLVDLRVGTGHDQPNLLTALPCGLAHDPRKLVEDLAEWHHSNV